MEILFPTTGAIFRVDISLPREPKAKVSVVAEPAISIDEEAVKKAAQQGIDRIARVRLTDIPILEPLPPFSVELRKVWPEETGVETVVDGRSHHLAIVGAVLARSIEVLLRVTREGRDADPLFVSGNEHGEANGLKEKLNLIESYLESRQSAGCLLYPANEEPEREVRGLRYKRYKAADATDRLLHELVELFTNDQSWPKVDRQQASDYWSKARNGFKGDRPLMNLHTELVRRLDTKVDKVFVVDVPATGRDEGRTGKGAWGRATLAAAVAILAGVLWIAHRVESAPAVPMSVQPDAGPEVPSTPDASVDVSIDASKADAQMMNRRHTVQEQCKQYRRRLAKECFQKCAGEDDSNTCKTKVERWRTGDPMAPKDCGFSDYHRGPCRDVADEQSR